MNAIKTEALGRVDLLTVILHELLHQLGADDLDALTLPNPLMAETLPLGQRRLPASDELDLLFADADGLDSVLNSMFIS